MLAVALIALGLIASLFLWCACVLAGRADEAIENFLNENPNGDRLPLSCRRQVPGGSSSRTAAGDSTLNVPTDAEQHARIGGALVPPHGRGK